jgi:hypothetical protein
MTLRRVGLESAGIGNPLGIRWESAGNPPGIRWESVGNPPGIRWESARNPAWNPLRVRPESADRSAGSPSPSRTLFMRTFRSLVKHIICYRLLYKYFIAAYGVPFKRVHSGDRPLRRTFNERTTLKKKPKSRAVTWRSSRKLATLPPARLTPRKNSKRELIEQLRGPLVDALVDRHYSFAALAEVLSQRGLDIHPTTLRHYLGPIDRSARRTASGG